MAWRVLNMTDVSEFPEVLDPLHRIAEVVTLPPDQRADPVDGVQVAA